MLDFKSAVFFGAHTDDEMVCAGTLHRLARSGCAVTIVTFAPAAVAQDRRGGRLSSGAVHPEWRRSLEAIGAQGQFFDMTPSVALHERGQEIADHVFAYCERNKPELALILSPQDENPAHAACGVACERVMRGRVPNVLRCPFPWNFERDRPNLFVALSAADLLAKRAAIDAYPSQHFRYHYGAMLMNYAIADGLSVKVDAAERFEIIRSVV